MLDKNMQLPTTIRTVKPSQRLRHRVSKAMQLPFYCLLFIQIIAWFIHIALLLPCHAGMGGTALCNPRFASSRPTRFIGTPE
jgi:hypothetical protein